MLSLPLQLDIPYGYKLARFAFLQVRFRKFLSEFCLKKTRFSGNESLLNCRHRRHLLRRAARAGSGRRRARLLSRLDLQKTLFERRLVRNSAQEVELVSMLKNFLSVTYKFL